MKSESVSRSVMSESVHGIPQERLLELVPFPTPEDLPDPGLNPHLLCLLQWRRPRFDPWVRKIPWKREWLLTPVFLPGEFHAQRILAGYSPWSCKESDMTEQLTLSLSYVHTHTHTHIHIHIHSFSFFPLLGYYKILS